MKSSWEQVETAAASAGLTLPLSWFGLGALCEAQGMQVRRCSVARRAYVCEVAGESIITLPETAGDAVEALAEEVSHILAIRWNGHRIQPVREQPRSVRLFLAGDGRSEAEAAEELLRRLGEDLGDDPTEPQKRDRILTLVRKVVVSVDAEQNPRQAVLYTHWRFFRD